LRYVRYGFTLTNPKGELAPIVELWVCAPVPETGYQRCGSVKASHAYEDLRDDRGNRILHFVFTNIPPHGVKIITVEADVAMRDEPGRQAAPEAFWLAPERLAEFDHPEFVRLAPRFTERDPARLARLAFDWTRGHVRDAGYVKRDRGALLALKNGVGDCTETMALFVALCRMHGVPARGMGGYVCRRNEVLRPAMFHNWAEFYAEGAWRVADPQAGLFQQKGGDYVVTRIYGDGSGPMRDYSRFRVEPDTIEVVMNP
jgi:transglutaminase-like putative cysteine protease